MITKAIPGGIKDLPSLPKCGFEYHLDGDNTYSFSIFLPILER